MQIVKAGIREFRAGLADYIQDGSPVAVTRHGQTVGVFIPTQTGETVDMAALEQASSALDALLSMHRIDPEELVLASSCFPTKYSLMTAAYGAHPAAGAALACGRR